jgi:hypothetical protein
MNEMIFRIPMPRLASVEVVSHLTICVTWSAGIRASRTDIVDLKPLIDSLKFYRPLRNNQDLFRTVHLFESGTMIAWGDDQIEMAADSVEHLAEESFGASDFRDFLISSKLTHAEAAALLGRSRRQIENYLAGTESVPRVVVLACFGLEARMQPYRAKIIKTSISTTGGSQPITVLSTDKPLTTAA